MNSVDELPHWFLSQLIAFQSEREQVLSSVHILRSRSPKVIANALNDHGLFSNGDFWTAGTVRALLRESA
jgi:hypothetical protein